MTDSFDFTLRTDTSDRLPAPDAADKLSVPGDSADGEPIPTESSKIIYVIDASGSMDPPHGDDGPTVWIDADIL